MVLQALRSFGWLSYSEIRGLILRPKTIGTLVLVTLAFLVGAWAIGSATIAPVEEEEDGVVTYPGLWKEGIDGALATQAMGIAPLLLPLVPIVLGYDLLARDRESGFLEMVASRPVPRSRMALAKFTGAFTVVVIPAVLLALTSTWLLEGIVGESSDPSLVLGFLLSTILLMALYLALTLLFASWFSAGATLALGLLLWIVFNAVTPSAFIIAGQFLLVVPIRGAPTFHLGLIDLVSFTGLYQGVMAAFTPATLGLVIWPSLNELGALVAAWTVTVAGIPWGGALLVGHLILFGRLQIE